MDIKSAYLNAPLDYEIYVDSPKGVESKNENYVWKLKKSLYRLKQCGRIWNKTFHTYLITQNFEQSPVDVLYPYPKHPLSAPSMGSIVTLLFFHKDDFGLVSLFNSISTFVGYLMPKPFS